MINDRSTSFDYTIMSFANILELNPNLCDMYYFSNIICRDARSMVINEYCDELCSFSVKSNIRNAPLFRVSAANSFGNKNEIDFKNILSNLVGPRILVVYSISDIDFLNKIYRTYDPDILFFQDLDCIDDIINKEVLIHKNSEFYQEAPEIFKNLNFNLCSNRIGLCALIEICNIIDGTYRIYRKKSELELDFAAINPKFGYYKSEYKDIYSWTWSGPTNSACFYIPVIGKSANTKLTLFFLKVNHQVPLEKIQFLVNHNYVKTQYFQHDYRVEIYLNCNNNLRYNLIEIRYMHGVFINDQKRHVGVAIQKIKIEEVI